MPVPQIKKLLHPDLGDTFVNVHKIGIGHLAEMVPNKGIHILYGFDLPVFHLTIPDAETGGRSHLKAMEKDRGLGLMSNPVKYSPDMLLNPLDFFAYFILAQSHVVPSKVPRHLFQLNEYQNTVRVFVQKRFIATNGLLEDIVIVTK